MPTLLPKPQRPNNIPQTTQTAIDILRLLQPFTCTARMAQALTPGQIDEIERTLALLARDAVLAGEFEDEDGVGAGGALVCFCGGDGAIGGRAAEDGFDFGGGVEVDGGDVCDGGFAFLHVVTDFVFLFVEFFGFAEEIV